MNKWYHRLIKVGLFLCITCLVSACDESSNIVTNVDEREANIIVVFLESKGIKAFKQLVATGPAVGGEGPASPKFNIMVDPTKSIEAMAILNANGLPHRQGTNLLELFAKQGLMSTDKEETIRYQAGLAQQIANMILMIDGVLDCNVQISFPQTEGAEEGAKQVVTAAVFVKHQGIVDDPNSHLENKIKRLVSGSVQGLDISNVTVVSDKSRFTDVTVNMQGEPMNGANKEYVKIWSIVMSKESVAKFRSIFMFLLFIAIFLAVIIGWTIWKIYPLLKTHGGVKEFFNPLPFFKKGQSKEKPPEEIEKAP